MTFTEAEEIHRTLLEKWRSAMNLVGPGGALHHFEDAARSVSGLDASGAWADLGSGAGFPGIALAARHTETSVMLVESRERRVAFLKAVVHAASLSNVTVFHGRTEDVEPGFDGIISRAYRPPELYLQDAARLLKPDGGAVLLSGETPPPFDGWRVISSDRYPLGRQSRVRTVMARN